MDRALTREPVLPGSRESSRRRTPQVFTQVPLRTRAASRRVTVLDGTQDLTEVTIEVAGKSVQLTNLQKPFWNRPRVTKGDLLRYYAAISPVLIPHLHDRALVMKRYPDGAGGEFFFMKRAPTPHPEWLETCPIRHAGGRIIEFPMVQDLASLLWVVNLGCIDLNPWYARCDDVERPDYLHFDLDPTPDADFALVRETALLVRDALSGLGMKPLAKTTGSRGIHVYVPIERGPTQKQVWSFAKALARHLASWRPKLVTAEYRVAKRPRRRVLMDYNQNAWGRTLASVYSARPNTTPTVSAPVTWEEVEAGATIEDFSIENVPPRVDARGDLFRPLLLRTGRFRLESVLGGDATREP